MSSHGGVLARLTELIGELAGCEPSADGLIGLRKVINQAEAEFCRQVRAFDARQEYAAVEQGCETMPAWLRHYCHLAPGDASRRVRVARMLPALPDTEAAFAGGGISFPHAALVVELARKTSVQDAREAEPVLVPLALATHPANLRVATKRVQYCLDPDGSVKDLEKQYQRRYVDLVETLQGRWHLEGSLDPEAGAKLKTALDAIMGIPAKDDPRSRQQRQADALTDLADQVMGAGLLASRGRRKPQVHLTVSLDTLQGMRGSEPADLDGCSTPMPAQTAQRLACDGEITRIVLNPDSEILEVGRAKRVAHPALDKAIRHRDRYCRWETCERPAQHCELHHRQPWWAGGHTNLTNMIMLCGYHHRLVHEGRQPLRLRPILRT